MKMTKKSAQEFLKCSKVFVETVEKSKQIQKVLDDCGFTRQMNDKDTKNDSFISIGDWGYESISSLICFNNNIHKLIQADDIIDIELEEMIKYCKMKHFNCGDLVSIVDTDEHYKVKNCYYNEEAKSYMYELDNNKWYYSMQIVPYCSEPKFHINDRVIVNTSFYKNVLGTIENYDGNNKYTVILQKYFSISVDESELELYENQYVFKINDRVKNDDYENGTIVGIGNNLCLVKFDKTDKPVTILKSSLEPLDEEKTKDNNMDDKKIGEAIKLLGPDVLKIKDDEELEKVFTEKKKIDAETEKKFVTAKPKKKKYLELKDNHFEFIRVTGNPDQFSELKHFCGGDITITYETCAIDDYWCIMLDDCLKEKKVVVPNNDYIVKMPDNSGFTVVDSVDVSQSFNIMEAL